MNIVLFLIGLGFSIGVIFVYDYLLHIEFLKNILTNNYLSYELSILLIITISFYLIYYFLTLIGLNKYKKEFTNMNNTLLKFLRDRSAEFKTDDIFLKPIFENFNVFKNQFVELERFYAEKRKQLQSSKEELLDILNIQDAMVFKVTVDGKVLEANNKAMKFFGFPSTFEFNKAYSNLSSTFDVKLDEDWITKNVSKVFTISVKGKRFQVFLDKLPQIQEYMVFLRDVSSLEEKIEKLSKLAYYDEGTHLKNRNMLNRDNKVVLINIYNYEQYSQFLSDDIMNLFMGKFVKRVEEVEKSSNICRLSSGMFSMEVNEQIDLKKFKNSIERTMTLFVGSSKYVFNPILLVSGGNNYESAKKARFESTYFNSKWGDNITKMDLSKLTVLNESIFENRVALKFRKMVLDGANVFYLFPIFKEKFTGEIIDDDSIVKLSKKLNLYTKMLKNSIFNDLSNLKGRTIFIDFSESDFYFQNDFIDLIKFVKSNSINTIFNIRIEKDYVSAIEIIKVLKQYGFKVSLSGIGVTYFNIKDIYSLKIDYLMIDDSIENLIKNDKRWSFIVDEVENLLKYGNTKIITNSKKGFHIEQKDNMFGTIK